MPWAKRWWCVSGSDSPVVAMLPYRRWRRSAAFVGQAHTMREVGKRLRPGLILCVVI